MVDNEQDYGVRTITGSNRTELTEMVESFCELTAASGHDVVGINYIANQATREFTCKVAYLVNNSIYKGKEQKYTEAEA